MSRGIHLLYRGREHGFGVDTGELYEVAGLVPWIAAKVLRRGELGGIDEDRRYGALTQPLAGADQGKMPVMDRSHGRHKRDGLASCPEAAHEVSQLRDPADGYRRLHCHCGFDTQVYRQSAPACAKPRAIGSPRSPIA